MKVFNNAYAGGGCIDGNGLVSMADGTTKYVKAVRKGDEILGADGKAVKVVCVVRTQCGNNKAHFTQFESGLRITPYHPVRIGGQYSFPCTIEQTGEYECAEVFNFVLESHHFMTINGIECVTLGHGLQEDVVKHPYFGTEAVLEDLMKMEGWENGFVELRQEYIERDPKTGLISSITRTRVQENSQTLISQVTSVC